MAMWSCSKCKGVFFGGGEEIVITMIDHQSKPCKPVGRLPEVRPLDLGIDRAKKARKS
jgi:hypothetical protein